jgi:hypothetical protein
MIMKVISFWALGPSGNLNRATAGCPSVGDEETLF